MINCHFRWQCSCVCVAHAVYDELTFSHEFLFTFADKTSSDWNHLQIDGLKQSIPI